MRLAVGGLPAVRCGCVGSPAKTAIGVIRAVKATMSKSYWKTRGKTSRSDKLHTDKNCLYLQRARLEPRKVRLKDYDHLEMCKYCLGEQGNEGSHGPSLPHKLEKMDPNEV